MPNSDVQQMLTTIIDHAQSSESFEFRFIDSWTAYKFYKDKRRSFRILVKALESGSERLLKNYCKKVISGTANLNSLLAYKQLLRIIDFYKQELNTITDMLDEYEAYLMHGNFFWSYLGEIRSVSDMYDFRGLD